MIIFKGILSNSRSHNFKICWLERFCTKFATCHSTIETKPPYVKSSIYIDFNVGNNEKDPKFKFDDHVKM